MEGIYSQHVRYTPVGEYIRILVLKKLAHGPAEVGEIDQMLKEMVEPLGIRYDWRIWPKLLENEVEINNGIATITSRGRWILEQTSEEVAKYVKKWLGVSL
jgi:hypothetical protein